MKHWNSKEIGLGIAAIALLSYALMNRQEAGVSANDRNADMQPVLSERTLLISPETAIVPAGTRIHIRLKDAISTEKNSSEDHFTASLDGPLIVNRQLFSPSRNEIIGQMTKVEVPDGVEGRTRLTMVLKKLVVNGKEYLLETQPLTFDAQDTRKKEDTEVIGGGSGAESVLTAKKGVPVIYEPASRFMFTLSAPVEMPVIRKMGGVYAARLLSPRRDAENAIATKDRGDWHVQIRSSGRTENEN